MEYAQASGLAEAKAALETAMAGIRKANANLGTEFRKQRQAQKIDIGDMARLLECGRVIVRNLEQGQAKWSPKWVERYQSALDAS